MIIGNVVGAREPAQPKPEWTPHTDVGAVLTRAQTANMRKPVKPLVVKEGSDEIAITRQKLVELQKVDNTLDHVRATDGKQKRTKDCINWFRVDDDVLYRYRKRLRSQKMMPRQVVVPVRLRDQVLQTAHDSILAGHMGITFTMKRIQTCFYWPGMDRDIRNYCRSCDICQRTPPKGKVGKVTLGKMPLIDMCPSRATDTYSY